MPSLRLMIGSVGTAVPAAHPFIRLLTWSCTVVLAAFISFPFHALQGRYWNAMQVFLPVFLLLLMLDRRRSTPLFQWTDWPLWVFVLCLASGVVSPANRAVALHRYLELSTTALLLYYVGKALMSLQHYRNLVMTVMGLCAGLAALYGIWYMVDHKDSTFFIASMTTPDAYRPFQQEYAKHFHPTILGNVLALSSICAWYACRHGRPVVRTIGCAAWMLCLVGVLMPWWRGTPWVFALVWLIFLLLGDRRRAPWLLVMVALTGMALIGALQSSSKFDLGQAMSGPHGLFSQYRVTRLHRASLMFKDAPAFGVGFDQYRDQFDRYARLDDDAPSPWYVRSTPNDLKVAENMYATLLAETGLIGLGGFLLFVVALLKRGLRAARRAMSPEHRTSLALSIAIMGGLLISMLRYELFYWHGPFMMLSMVCGWLASLTGRRTFSGRVPPLPFERSETSVRVSDGVGVVDHGQAPTTGSVMATWAGVIAVVCGVSLVAVRLPAQKLSSLPERYDEWGFRNITVPIEADAVTFGSGLTYGEVVRKDQVWPQQLAQLGGVTVYNMAFPRYGAVHGLLLLKASLMLRPRVIVQALDSGGNFYHAYRAVYARGLMPELKTDDPELLARLREMDQQAPLEAILRERQWSHEQARRAQSWGAPHDVDDRRALYLAVDTQPIRTILTPAFHLAMLDAHDPRIGEGFKLSLRAIVRAHQQLRERGVEYCVLLIPTKELAYQEVMASAGRSAVYAQLIHEEEDAWRLAKTFFAQHGVPAIEALPVLQASLKTGESPYYASPVGDFNATGHRIIAELVLSTLRGQHLLEPGVRRPTNQDGPREPGALLTGANSWQP